MSGEGRRRGVGGFPAPGVLVAVLIRPSLWYTALVELRRFARRGWWRRPPFLPLPDPALVAFRAETQYGDPDHAPEPGDVVTWLRWCRAERRRGWSD